MRKYDCVRIITHLHSKMLVDTTMVLYIMMEDECYIKAFTWYKNNIVEFVSRSVFRNSRKY